MTNLTASLENYLETILTIQEEKQNVKAIEISKKLSISKASVSEALKTLNNKGYITYAPFEDIILTPKGIDYAQKIAHKHDILFDFLSNILGIEHKESVENACRIEHVISETVLERFIDFLEFNKHYHNDKSTYIQDFHAFCKVRSDKKQ